MASLDGVGQHPLSLKVMRISRPSLASHWTPFFSSSPSFSAHSTASALSLQGTTPLSGHPKTLRDLTQASPLLTLPSAFGAIQLGETFSCALSVNNEVETPVDAVMARVEMQTATSKVALAEIAAGTGATGNQSGTLNVGDSLEMSVACEIKELGQHVLACTVTYRTPPGMRPATSGSSNSGDPFVQTFRKFYKFTVTNPLSVKTKVHVPRSPSALLSRDEREKVFLEVYIQNLTPGPLWFESIKLDSVDGWHVTDTNVLDNNPGKSLFSGSMALMSPQDLRVYLYILTPKTVSSVTSVLVPPVPGTVIPLGRLDISWRTSMGEPGRLLTSVLSRRIPLPPSGVAPASALPPYLQKGTLPNVPRARSPSLQQPPPQGMVSGGVPPQRPGSPLKRSTTPAPPSHAMSPISSAAPLPPLPGQPPSRADIEVDIVLIDKPDKSTVFVERSFSLRFSLVVSALLPLNTPNLLGQTMIPKSRKLTFAIQHTSPVLQPEMHTTATNSGTPTQGPRRLKKTMSFDTVSSTPGIHSPASRTGSIDVLTPRRVMSPPPGSGSTQGAAPSTSGAESYVTSPTSAGARATGTVTVGGLTERLRRVALSEALGLQDSTGSEVFGDEDEAESSDAVRLPSPYSTSAAGVHPGKIGENMTGRVQFSGSSATLLPPITLFLPTLPEGSSTGNNQSIRGEGTIEFSLSFLPRQRGFARIGGLRILLVEDQEQQIADETQDDTEDITLHARSEIHNPEAQIIREWDVIAEVWVR